MTPVTLNRRLVSPSPRQKPVWPATVNRDHWLGSLLGAAWVPQATGDGPALLTDLVGNIHLAPRNDAGSNPVGETIVTKYSQGFVVRGRSTSAGDGQHGYYLAPEGDPFTNKQRFCVIGLVTFHDISTLLDPRVLAKDLGANEQDHDWMIGAVRARFPRARIRINGTTHTALPGSGKTIANGDTLLIVGGYDGSSVTVRGFWDDGGFNSASNSAPGGSLTSTYANDIAVFRTAGTTQNYANASLHFGACVNDYLTDDQCWRLLQEPYQFLIPANQQGTARRRLISLPGGTTPVTSDMDLRWNLLAQVTRDNAMRWAILNAVDSNIQYAWELLNRVTGDLALAWDVLNQLNADVDLRWNIQSAVTAVTSELSLNWDIRQAIVSTLDTRWDILNALGVDLDMRWHIAAAVVSELQTQWDIFNSVSADAQLRWDSLQATQSSMTLQWSVDGLAITPITFIKIPAERRVNPVPAEDRMIPVPAEQRIQSVRRN